MAVAVAMDVSLSHSLHINPNIQPSPSLSYSSSFSCGGGSGGGVGSSGGSGGVVFLGVISPCPSSRACCSSASSSSSSSSLKGSECYTEELWKQFFSDPSQWWDHRLEKRNPNHPDFKHKHTKVVLWVDRRSNPSWVQEKLASLTEGMTSRSVFTWNSMIQRHLKNGQYEKALIVFDQLQMEGVKPDRFTVVRALNACAKMKALERGRLIHEQVIAEGLHFNVFVASALVNMYAKCGSIEDAERVFISLTHPDLVCWNAMILGCVKCGHGQKALKLFRQMQLEGLLPDTSTFVAVLNACASIAALDEGRSIHAQIIRSGCELNEYVGAGLVDMYAKCGSIEEAYSLFNKLQTRDAVCWNSMIKGFVKSGLGQRALELYQQMLSRYLKPDHVTYVAVLNACASIKAIEKGRQIHAQIVESGYEYDDFVTTCLVDMYVKCGSAEEAFQVFEKINNPGVVCWTSMIVGYAMAGNGKRALELYGDMQAKRIRPDKVIFVAVLCAFSCNGLLQEGRYVHSEIIRHGYELDNMIGAALVDMYAKCGSIEDSRRVFNKLESPCVVCWTALTVNYVKFGKGEHSLELYKLMLMEQVEPNAVTFVGLLNACASVGALEDGRSIHTQILKRGYGADDFVVSALVDMYAKCGSIAEAYTVFDNHSNHSVVSWTSMIMSYAKCGYGKKALQLYRQMEFEQLKPDVLTFLGVINACTSTKALEEGKRIHRAILCCGLQADDFLGSALIDMYAECGSIEDASSVFDSTGTRSVVCWNSMIAGFVKCGLGQRALDLYRQMQLKSLEPDVVTFILILNACASVTALVEGRRIHSQIIERGLESDRFILSSLVDMYAKCGSIEEAHRVFVSVDFPTVPCWTAMIGAYAIHGQGKEAIHSFDQMSRECGEVNGITFVSLLAACRHSSLVDEGLYFYESMEPVYGSVKCLEHSACMVDLLGHVGFLDDAENMFHSLPSVSDVTAWSALLAACKVHGNLRLGEYIAKKVIELDPDNSSAYVLLSNIYSLAGNQEKKQHCPQND